MSVNFIPTDAGQQFSPSRLNAILSWLADARDDVAPVLKCGQVDCLVVPGKRVIPGWNCAAYATSRWLIQIFIDPDCEGRETFPLGHQLRSVLAHELHHAMRMGGPGYGTTLGEALVSEGLAQCFEEQMGCETPNYATAVRGPKLAALADMARAEVWAESYDHPKWFYGSRKDERFPWSGGYSLGYVLVKRWLEGEGLSASEAVDVHAKAVLADAFDRTIPEFV